MSNRRDKPGHTAQDADALTAMPSVVLQVERDSDGADIGVVFVAITINDVNEAPEFMTGAPASLNVEENAQPGTMVGDAITATDQDGDGYRRTPSRRAALRSALTAARRDRFR